MADPKATPLGGSTTSESSRTSSKVLTAGDRKLLKVELRPGETTYVSWKKLMRDASKDNGSSASVPDPPPNANPNLESRLAPGQPAETGMVDQPHSNRFNAVIEKIERLYMGRDSSDGEELDGAPDDDEYDTEDSFIDDVELDEYFEVDNSAIKHDGFFVNRGTLERIEPSTTSNQQPKKRQRKESTKSFGDVSIKQAKVAKMGRVKDQSPSGSYLKKKASDSKTVHDSVLPLKAQSGNHFIPVDNVKNNDKANHRPTNATSPKSKATGFSDPLHPKSSNKSCPHQPNSLPGKCRPNVSPKSTVVRHKEKNGTHDQANATGSRQIIQKTKKDSSSVLLKTSTLEKAIKELERTVAELRPPGSAENQDVDTSSQAVKRRLPRDVKLKLAKVARIAASQGKVSEEFIDRLMSIVGHLMQRKSLKRNVKIMGDSANREKDTRFLQIKNEVIEMLKPQILLMESQEAKHEAGTSEVLQDGDSAEKPSLKKKRFEMDPALDDKLCELYDIFVDGMDEDSGSQIRKLYANLAELWPNKSMDNHGIKRAICRAKERRRALHENLKKETDQAKMTKKKQTQLGPKSEAAAWPDKTAAVQRQHNGDKMAIVPFEATTSLIPNQPTSNSSRDRSKQQHEKLKGTSSSNIPAEEKKTARRKTEPGLEKPHPSMEKQFVLALTQQAHPRPQAKTQVQTQVQTQATPDLNLPS